MMEESGWYLGLCLHWALRDWFELDLELQVTCIKNDLIIILLDLEPEGHE